MYYVHNSVYEIVFFFFLFCINFLTKKKNRRSIWLDTWRLNFLCTIHLKLPLDTIQINDSKQWQNLTQVYKSKLSSKIYSIWTLYDKSWCSLCKGGFNVLLTVNIHRKGGFNVLLRVISKKKKFYWGFFSPFGPEEN